jgi:hypothetical protein
MQQPQANIYLSSPTSKFDQAIKEKLKIKTMVHQHDTQATL